MNLETIRTIVNKCYSFLNKKQLKKLNDILLDLQIKEAHCALSNNELFSLFIKTKYIEGCSGKTIKLYKTIVESFIKEINKQFNMICTDDIRKYLIFCKSKHEISNITLDNIRRVLSSLFSYLENENYIDANPLKRIRRIKSTKTIKKPFTEDEINIIKDSCNNTRDYAIVDLLRSTGIRVSELVSLNINQIDLNNKECIVFGKGSKERKVYFDSASKMSLTKYLNTRNDTNKALFVSLLEPHKRIKISCVEIFLRNIEKVSNINDIHPHRFRRTFATKAIEKGMPIEQVQILLGHTKLDTTLIYANVNQINVKNSYRKIID